MKNPKILLPVLAVLAIVLVQIYGAIYPSPIFFRGSKPIIEIKAETITDLGPIPLVNTYTTSLFVVISLILVAYFATRKINIVPRGLQNFTEWVMEIGYNICINTAGEKNGRRFFPLIMTIFTFIWIANWMALLPFFNVIGTVEKVDAANFHKEAVVFSKNAGLRLIQPNQKALEFEVDKTEVDAIQKEIDDAAAAGRATNDLETQKEDALKHARAEAIRVQLPKAAGIKVDTSACKTLTGTEQTKCVDEKKLAKADEAAAKLQADDEEIGVLIPYFRSMNTDLNSPLSIAIWAMIFIEFWGISTLGVFKYGAKFFNLSSPISFFVGILEFIAEIARIISFTFRLFGNMLAGEILLLVMTFLIPFLVALPFYALEVFVGLIQAFVFAMLTLVFGVLATSSHEDHEDHGVEEPAPIRIENIPAGVEPAHS